LTVNTIKTMQELNLEFMRERRAAAVGAGAGAGATPETGVTSEMGAATSATSTTSEAVAVVPLWKDLLYLFMKIGTILLIFTLLSTFLFGFVRYQDPSMDPAIKDGDLIIYYRYGKEGYLPRDTIVLNIDGVTQARRIVAMEGDIVDIKDNGLYINGAFQHETEVHQQTERYADGISFPLTVPEGHIFVLGDSRVGATDSRIYGSVDINDTLGKVITVLRRRSI